MISSMLIVLSFALTQHLVVLGIPLAEIHIPYLIIPSVVGSLFGFLIATIRVFHIEQGEYLRQIEAHERELQREVNEREQTAQREQRLQYALGGANDGLWDWNIATGEVYYSPRWCEMLGYRPDEVPPHYEFWHENLHPEDAAEVQAALQAHLQGETEVFRAEFRCRGGNGEWVWVLGRGKVVEWDEHGKPLRAVGTQTNISDRKRTAQAIEGLLAGTAAALGSDFFAKLVENLALILEMRFAVIGLVNLPDSSEITPLAVWPEGFLHEGDCNTEDTPCGTPARGETAYIHDSLQDLYPHASMVKHLDGESYFGEPIVSSTGRVIGVLAAIDDKPLSDWKQALAEKLLPIFAARAAAEIERNHSETELFREKDRAQTTLSSIGDGVITTNAQGYIEFINPVAVRITGWSVEDALGRLFEEVCPVTGEISGQAENIIHKPLTENMPFTAEDALVLSTHDGKTVTVEMSAAPIRDKAGRMQGVVVVLRDVTHAREMARQLTWQATHDALTGLKNRKEFERELRDVLAAPNDQTNALLYLDLDQFKVVNDISGHSAGDELLRQLGLLLDSSIRQSDVLARLGGDEFGLILKGCDEEQAREIADKLTRVVKDFRFGWKDKVFEIGVSIGIVMLDGQVASSASALSAADIACYAAKDLGRNRYHLYLPDDEELARRHGEMQWVSRIHRALADDRFVLFAQQIVGMEDNSPGMHEVLVRMLDEERNIIPTGSFIPAAERYGIMPEIDRWVIDRAFRYLADDALELAKVSINLSGLSLGDERIVQHILDRRRHYGVEPSAICFEITETAAIANLSQAVRFISTLAEEGFVFALDDFGSGLSSFGYLKRLPVSYLKIDGSFVRDMCEDPIDRAMVHAINEIGHTMGIKTIAEYVENTETLAMLKGIGVDMVQGYHIHKPEPIIRQA